MLIRSKNVWIAGQFFPADVEIEDGRIAGIFYCLINIFPMRHIHLYYKLTKNVQCEQFY